MFNPFAIQLVLVIVVVVVEAVDLRVLGGIRLEDNRVLGEGGCRGSSEKASDADVQMCPAYQRWCAFVVLERGFDKL